MAPPFTASCATLAELLGGRMRLSVPEYQRAFAWTEHQAGQLLDDLLLTLEESGDGAGDYFLGAMVLMQTEGPGAQDRSSTTGFFPTHEIVDGLQRLVTLTMLFAVLRDIAEDEDAQTASMADACIWETLDSHDPVTSRVRLELSEGLQDFFLAFVQEPRATATMPEDDDLPAPEARLLAVREHLMASLLGESRARRRQLVELLRDRCHCAVICARTLDRAHHIFAVLNDRGLPLARGDILKAQILGSVAAERRQSIHERWVDAEHRLGGALDELFGHLRTIEGRSRARILDEIRALVERSGTAETFVERTLLPYAEILEMIRAPAIAETRVSPAIATRLTYLGWLGSHDWVAPLMLYWRLADRDERMLEAFIVRLDRLAYGMRLLGIGSDKRASRYKAVLDAIRSGTLDAPAGPLELSRDEQRLIAFNLRALHGRSQIACKLVLLRLNDAIAGSPQKLDPGELTVEHVLPQKPARESQWREWFPDAEERERCTQSIGNLILVSRHKNEQARNLELARKLEIYFEAGIPQPAITRDIEGLVAWRPEDVLRREERLVSHLSALWGFGATRPSPVVSEPAAAPPALRPRPVKPRPVHRAPSRR